MKRSEKINKFVDKILDLRVSLRELLSKSGSNVEEETITGAIGAILFHSDDDTVPYGKSLIPEEYRIRYLKDYLFYVSPRWDLYENNKPQETQRDYGAENERLAEQLKLHNERIHEYTKMIHKRDGWSDIKLKAVVNYLTLAIADKIVCENKINNSSLRDESDIIKK